MKPHTFFLLLGMSIFLASCASAQTTRANPTPNEQWVDQYNRKMSAISSLYAEKPVLISGKETITEADTIQELYRDFQKTNGTIKSIQTHFTKNVQNKQEYEIGSFATAKGKTFTHLLIWTLQEGGGKKRLLELVLEKSSSNEDVGKIHEAREKWMLLCNAHTPDQLVGEVYTEDAIYYSRGKIWRGTDSITEEYDYMSRKDYSLALTPLHLEKVTDEIAFEIGQCKGSYNSPYMLVWQKQASGDWKVFMDANY